MVFIQSASADCNRAIAQIPGASFQIKKPSDKIIHLEFESQDEMTRSFVRIQEHYESPEFQNKIFTLKEFKEWYTKSRNATRFTYYEDWGGFNLPDYILKPFFDGSFKRQSPREKNILAAARMVQAPFYIIGTYREKDQKSSSDTLDHEIAHSFFYLYPRYRKQVMNILRDYDLNPIFRFLLKMGYGPATFHDETASYLAVDFEWLLKQAPEFEDFREASERLSKLFKVWKSRKIKQSPYRE